MYCFNCFNEMPEGPCPYCGYQNHSNESQYPTALREGTVLADQYIIGRVLGQGGFGVTYVAFNNKLRLKFAIKEYLPESICTRTPGTTDVLPYSGEKRDSFEYGKQCFLDEARTMGALGNLHGIAAVIAFFEENSTSYFVMDYVEGISFKGYLKNKGGRVSYDDAARVLMPVLNTLETVHAHGLIHRDVACDNIYITKDDAIKLLDFGAAQYSLGDKSRSFDAVLKPGYTPKEQYMRHGRQGAFTDVYALGACFYAAMTGFLPPEALERMENDEILSISACGFQIPPQAEDAIMKALEVDAADRFQSMAEFRSALTVKGTEARDAASSDSSERAASDMAGVAGSAAAVDPAPQSSPFAAMRKSPLLPIAAGGGCVLAVLAILLLLVLDVFPEESSKPPGSGGGYSNAPGTSAYPGGATRLGDLAAIDDSDNLGSVVYYDDRVYFAKRNAYVTNAILGISQEKGAVAEEIYHTKGEREITGLAVSGEYLYWIEIGYYANDEDHISWLMRSEGDFASPERVIELDGFAYFCGADQDAVYIYNYGFDYNLYPNENALIRVTHRGNASSAPIPNLFSEYDICKVYQDYIYYIKTDPASNHSFDESTYWRGLFRRPVDKVFASGEFEDMPEELVTDAFVLIAGGGDYSIQTVFFHHGNVYFLEDPYGDSSEANIEALNLRTLKTSSATVKTSWIACYAADGDTVYYFDPANWTVNQAGTAIGGAKKIADVPEENYYELDGFKVIGSWLYAMPALYNDTAVRIALDESGLLETIYPSAGASTGGGSGNEDEDLYFVTSYDDYGIYVRSTPSTATDANKILYIEPGDRGVVMHWLGLTEYHEGHNWYHVQLPDSRTGWVRADVVRIYMRNGEMYL